MTSTFAPLSASQAATLTVVVVLPTPPLLICDCDYSVTTRPLVAQNKEWHQPRRTPANRINQIRTSGFSRFATESRFM
ncbi:MAG: hypothetical protein R2849_01565 [Thermomicrobiales bacterium]